MIYIKNGICFNVSTFGCKAKWQRHKEWSRIQVIDLHPCDWHWNVHRSKDECVYCTYACICVCEGLLNNMIHKLEWSVHLLSSKWYCDCNSAAALLAWRWLFCMFESVSISSLVSISQARWRWGLQSVCAAPEVLRSEPFGGHVLDSA